jgi:hypothetical protein
MQVAGDSREKAVELVKRLEDSKVFRAPVLKSEGVLDPAQTGGDTVQFEITADYTPQAPAAAVATTSPATLPSDKGTQPAPAGSVVAREGKH